MNERICQTEGCTNLGESNGKGDVRRPFCSTCRRKRNPDRQAAQKRYDSNRPPKSYRRHKGQVCERCGFVPEHPCQLDVDHVDGDHFNNELSNLQTLCANCHRLKTFENGEWTGQARSASAR